MVKINIDFFNDKKILAASTYTIVPNEYCST